MIKEKSCGAVIYRSTSVGVRFLLETMQGGHISLCKGHVEGNETEHETARREILEETALTVEFIDGFRETISYSPYDGCVKDVVFFLARATSSDTVPQQSEVRSLAWLSYEDALNMLTHDSDREILVKAGMQLIRQGIL